MDFDLLVTNKNCHVSVNKKDDSYEISVDGERLLVHSIRQLPNFISLNENGINRKVYFAKDSSIQYIFIEGEQYRIEDSSQMEQKFITKDYLSVEHESEICAPMPGKILKIFVQEGDEVAAKQNLVIVEAMKMENNINSPIKGKVKKINFKEGALVDTGQPIIELEALEENNGTNSNSKISIPKL